MNGYLKINIRPLNQYDLSALQAISRQTFHETFAADNQAEDMESYLTHRFSTVQLSRESANPNMHFYFAEQLGRPIGYLKLNHNHAQTELQTQHTMEIERIYVLKDWHGKGIGQMLYAFALKQAQAQQVDYLWLGVWEHNHKAMTFYRKNGFTPFGSHIFSLGNDPQTDILMKLTLPK